MKNIYLISVCLLLATTLILNNTPTSTSTSNFTPYAMTKKTFQLTPIEYQGGLIEYEQIKYLNLTTPPGLQYMGHPMGITYDKQRKVAWVVIGGEWSNPNMTNGVCMINVTDMSITHYQFPWQVDGNYYGPLPWTIAIDDNGKLWVSIEDHMVTPNFPPPEIPVLASLDVDSSMLTIYYLPVLEGDDIKFYEGYVWYLTDTGLFKINCTSEEVVKFYPRNIYGGFMHEDGDAFWISSVSKGLVTRFNITSEQFDVNITGLDRPLGLEVDEDFVYVAENSRNAGTTGTIVKINKTDFTYERISTGAVIKDGWEGPYAVLKDSFGYLWFTDISWHFGIISLTSGNAFVYNAISPFCYFITEIPDGSIWFSVRGSAYVGMKEIEDKAMLDINRDLKIDMADIGIVCVAYASTPGDARWNPDADINKDEKIDMMDIGFVCIHYGEYV